MQYYNDMLDKFGFHDGDAVPCGMKNYREVYVEALNRLLPELGSNIRVVPFDRGGLHNWCMILPVTKDVFEAHGIGVANSDVQLPHLKDEIDEAYHKAVLMAGDMQLDELVIVEARKVDDYQAQIEDLVASALEEQEEGRTMGRTIDPLEERDYFPEPKGPGKAAQVAGVPGLEILKPGRNLNPKMIGTCPHCGAIYRAPRSSLKPGSQIDGDGPGIRCPTEGCNCWVNFHPEQKEG